MYINNNETIAQIKLQTGEKLRNYKLQTEKQISDSSQIDRNMIRLTAPTDYNEPNVICLFHDQNGNCSFREEHRPKKRKQFQT